MKEATGELNMTVVTVVAIAAVGAFFALIIWPNIKGNIIANTHCSSAVNCGPAQNGMRECHYYDDNGNVSADPIQCPEETATNNNG